MSTVIAFVGYALVLYGEHVHHDGWEAAGCIVLGVGVGAFVAEQRRRRLTNPGASD